MRVYWEVGKRQFQQQLAYRTANIAGSLTNIFFGYIRATVFVAVFAGQQRLAGYDVADAVTYVWVTQAFIMAVALWGWWEVMLTIRSGAVVTDLTRPISYLGYWVSRDLGRALYFALFRALPLLLAGQLLSGLRWPESPATWALFLVSTMLAVLISFGLRFMINLSAFWMNDARGVGQMMDSLLLFLSGFVLPVRFFPDWLRALSSALPFAGIVQSPADIFLERVTGGELVMTLAGQAAWALALLAACQGLTLLATRHVEAQGG